MSIHDSYLKGKHSFLEKIAISDTVATAGTAFLSPTLSGLTAERGKGLQTSLGGIAGSLIGKKFLRNNLAGRLLGSAGATASSKVGDGLVSPDQKVLDEMRRRGQFSKWEYATRGLRTAGTGAAIGAGLATGAGIPAMMLGAGLGAGRGAFSGYVVSPMVKEVMRESMDMYRDRQDKRDAGQRVKNLQPPIAEKAMQVVEHPNIRPGFDAIQKYVI